ncbi:MAG: hypothetical protein ABSG41_25050 [Bryobacteraceae bacterium]
MTNKGGGTGTAVERDKPNDQTDLADALCIVADPGSNGRVDSEIFAGQLRRSSDWIGRRLYQSWIHLASQ